MGLRSKKSAWRISFNLGCQTPQRLRLTTKTASIWVCCKHSYKTPSPTIPVVPVKMTFMDLYFLSFLPMLASSP